MKTHVDFDVLEVGDALPPLKKSPVTKIQMVRYAGASGDFNPIHTDDAAAKQAGLKGVIAHGVLVMGIVGQTITRWVPKKYLNKFKVRFRGMTFPGDIIHVEAEVSEKIRDENGLKVVCSTAAKDQNGEMKLSGEFEVWVPND